MKLPRFSGPLAAITAGLGLLCAGGREAGSATITKIEVVQVELGYAVARPGVKVRLTLANHEAVEYRTEDATETEALLRMSDLFLSGRARMFAEVEGSAVRGMGVSGPWVTAARQ